MDHGTLNSAVIEYITYPRMQRVLGVKRPRREADHSPPSNAEGKNVWSYTSIPPVRLHGVVIDYLHGMVLIIVEGQFYLYLNLRFEDSRDLILQGRLSACGVKLIVTQLLKKFSVLSKSVTRIFVTMFTTVRKLSL
jgi:hypothetical protein